MKKIPLHFLALIAYTVGALFLFIPQGIFFSPGPESSLVKYVPYAPSISLILLATSGLFLFALAVIARRKNGQA
jgi:hypothetical protein